MFKKNKISIIFLIISIFVFSYFLYKEFNTTKDLKGYYLIQAYFFIFLSITLIIVLFLNQKTQSNYNMVLISCFVSLFICEGYLFVSGDIKIFSDKKGFSMNDYFFLQKEMKEKNGYVSYSLNEKNILSFSGLSNSKIIHCNENGYFSVYHSDRNGFNNPDYVWDKSIDIATVGDSFVHGSCVNQGNDLASQVRKITKLNTVNLGWHSTGPLRQYSSFIEYMDEIPKFVFWFYFENDLEELEYEMNNEILLKYYDNQNFKQYLKDTTIRKKINDLLLIKHNEFINEKLQLEPKVKIYHNLINFIKLYNSRQLIIYNINKVIKATSDDELIKNEEFLKIYLKLLGRMKSITDENNSKLIIVYLPRQKYGFSRKAKMLDKIKSEIFEFAENKKIDTIDIEKLIDINYINPTILYPQLHRGMHFNEKGYKFVAEQIAEYIDKNK